MRSGSVQVQDLVDGQGPGLAEPFAALGALERLLFGMDVFVVAQVVLPPEGLFANVARVWPFVCVGPLVDQQVVRLGKLSLAVFANVLPLLPRGGVVCLFMLFGLCFFLLLLLFDEQSLAQVFQY